MDNGSIDGWTHNGYRYIIDEGVNQDSKLEHSSNSGSAIILQTFPSAVLMHPLIHNVLVH